MSPEGNSVYVASNIANSISRFERRLAPPQTKIRSATIAPKKGTATFTFSSSEKGSTFRCKLGSNPFRACSSPRVYESLRQGTYVFEVRARNSQGTLDPTPATSKFTITG